MTWWFYESEHCRASIRLRSPILEQKWNTYIAANPDVAQQSGEQLQRVQKMRSSIKVAIYMQLTKAKEDESAVVDRLKNVAGDAVEGVRLIAGGRLKPAFGSDNIVSKGLSMLENPAKSLQKVYRLKQNDREAYLSSNWKGARKTNQDSLCLVVTVGDEHKHPN